MKSIIMLSLCKLRFPAYHYIRRLSHSKQYFSTKSTLSLSEQYQTLIKSNTIQYDIKQERVVQELDALYHKIQLYDAPKLPDKPCLNASAGTFDKKPSSNESKSKPGIFKQLLSSITKSTDTTWTPPAPTDIPNSLYVWGGTGTGKTMLMDLFYDSITSHHKHRVHFNTFMLELHAEIHQIKQNSSSTDDDVLPQLSLNLAKKSTIFYLDEFQVTDLVDALLLNRLLTSLFHYGCVIFVTSNREPDTLYLNGLQREQIFVPFLKLLKQKSMVIDLNTTNYRDLGYGYGYFTDMQPFEEAWNEMINFHHGEDGGGEKMKVVQVMAGRELECPRSIGSIATRFEFRELCARSKGTADFLALSKSFRTIFIEKIPFFGYDPDSRNEMKRFIWLIDELYNGKNRIVCLAAERPEQLLRVEDGDGKKHVFEEIFQFERCKKRLIEMQSIQYLEETKDIVSK